MPKVSSSTLSHEQSSLFDLLESSSDHFFITGRAGTGKSHLLNHFRQFSKKRIAVLAPTGVAALNVGGQTIHSFFRIAPGFIRLEALNAGDRLVRVLTNLDALVIDEVSMVRADLFDAIDHLCRLATKKDLPFGGLQIIMFGDPYQLPPVVDDQNLLAYFMENYGGYHFFHAQVWKNSPPTIYELTSVFRQKDASFKHLLDSVRSGLATQDHLDQLNDRCLPPPTGSQIIILCSTNRAADAINQSRLLAIPHQANVYQASVSGDLESNSFPAPRTLTLKPGAQVMLIKNDSQKRWVNGTLATVESLDAELVRVKIGKQIYSVAPEIWQKIRYTYHPSSGRVQEDVVSTFSQFPLKLAWAVTIHKSQGGTYDSVIIDLGFGAFAAGQTYVALSRCTSLSGIYLRRPLNLSDILVDAQVVSFLSTASVLSM